MLGTLMKHPLKITALLILLFIIAQVVGLFLVKESIHSVQVTREGRVLQHETTVIGERPALAGYQSFLYLVIGVAIGTALLLLLIRFRQLRLWKAWFFLAVFLAQSIAYGVFLPQLAALLLAVLTTWLKIYKPEPVIHNLTEIFIYAGIAVLLVPILDVTWALILLFTISLYDAWAVWKSKHMIRLAEFQKKSVFAGLSIPKRAGNVHTGRAHAGKMQTGKAQSSAYVGTGTRKHQSGGHAILGGGDITFPLLFTGAVMEHLIIGGLSKSAAFAHALLVTLGATIALTLLFLTAKKNTYYPAMPFLTAGCLVGWLATLVL